MCKIVGNKILYICMHRLNFTYAKAHAKALNPLFSSKILEFRDETGIIFIAFSA